MHPLLNVNPLPQKKQKQMSSCYEGVDNDEALVWNSSTSDIFSTTVTFRPVAPSKNPSLVRSKNFKENTLIIVYSSDIINCQE